MNSLSPELFQLYTKKLTDFHINDPYEMPVSEFQGNIENWPEVSLGDIVN